MGLWGFSLWFCGRSRFGDNLKLFHYVAATARFFLEINWELLDEVQYERSEGECKVLSVSLKSSTVSDEVSGSPRNSW